MYPFKYSDPLNLKTEDIDGCKIGSLKKINKYKGENLNLDIRNVPGALASSKKRGITTNRVTNPNWPDYKVPGHSELKNEYNNPYGKTAFDEKNKYTKYEEDGADIKINKTTNNFYPKKEQTDQNQKATNQSTENLIAMNNNFLNNDDKKQIDNKQQEFEGYF